MVTAIDAPSHDSPAGAPGHGHGHGHAHGKGPWQRFVELMRLEWSDVFTLLAFALGVGLLSLVAPAAIEALVNTVAFGILLWPVFVLAAVMFALLFVSAVLRALQTYVAECLQRRLFVRTALGFADRLARTGIESFDGVNRADVVNRFFEVAAGQKSIATLLVDGVGILMLTAVGLVVLAFYNPYLLTFSLVLAGLVVFLMLGLGIGGVRTSIAESYSKFDVAAWLEEVARCPHTFRSGQGARLALEHADTLSDVYLRRRRRHFAVIWRQTLFALLLEAVGSTVILGLGGWLVINRQLTLGQLVASELIVTLVLAALSKTGKYLEIFYDLQATLDKLGVLDRLPLESAGGELLPATGGPMALRLELPGPGGELRRLEIAPGERLAICGPSGGKTGLLETIGLMRQPAEGMLALDGIDARSLDRPATREQIAFLATGAEVFASSIAENVRLGREGIPGTEIRRAVGIVGLTDRVARLPEGMNTLLTPDGSPLSSNGARRLAFARAIAARPRLLLIDGLLDALDLTACPELLDALFDPEAGWTLVVVTARDDIRIRCDRVVQWV
jgi:putative ABC transport system ATP-binding protein